MVPAGNLADIDVSNIDMDQVGQLAQQFAQGTSLGTIRGLSPEHMEAIYSVAYNLYKNGRYEDALKVFKFLCLHDHLQGKFWMGLGATQQMLKQFKQAGTTYGYAYMLDSDNPQIPLHAADCFLADGNLPHAESALNLVIELTQNRPQHNAVRERAQVLLNIARTKKS